MKCIHDDEEDYSCIECRLFEECWTPIVREVNEIFAEIEKLQALQFWSYTIDVAGTSCMGCKIKKECLEDGEISYCPFRM